MSKEREALKLALECVMAWDRGCDRDTYWRDIEAAVTAIKEALAEQPASGLNPLWVATHPDGLTTPQPAQQEPVAVQMFRTPGCSDWYDGVPDQHELGQHEVRTLYTSPQPAQQALDKMAENARELGLDYEPAQHDLKPKFVRNVDGVPCITLVEHEHLLNRQTAQPQQEPVAWIFKPNMELLWPDEIEVKEPSKSKGYKPLYTSPPQRKPLTDDEIKAASLQAGMQEHYMGFHSGFIRFARAIEAAHGIKENT